MRSLFWFGIWALCVFGPTVTWAKNEEELFNEFCETYSRHYTDEVERASRFQVFQANLRRIDELNANAADFGQDVKFAINQFADMSVEEFRSQVLLSRRKAPPFSADRYAPVPVSAEDPPSAFDWRDKGAVNPIRDQGTVGTCWAFSTVANVAGVHFLATQQLAELSVEQIVDCDSTQDPASPSADCGVFGGWPFLAFDYVIKNGLLEEKSYPYCCGNGICYPCAAPGYNETRCGPYTEYCNKTQNKCDALPGPVVANISSWVAISKDEAEIAVQMMAHGPLSVCLDASWLQWYHSGIWNPLTCSHDELDHAVLLVGWGSKNGTPYWIVKNSWGTKWGMDGYFWIRRGKGTCGINTAVVTAVV